MIKVIPLTLALLLASNVAIAAEQNEQNEQNEPQWVKDPSCEINDKRLRAMDRWLRNLPKYELPKTDPNGDIHITRINPPEDRIYLLPCDDE